MMQVAYWLATCSFFSFSAAYFKWLQIDSSRSGLLISAFTFAGLCGQVLICKLSDKLSALKFTLILCLVISFLTTISIFLSTQYLLLKMLILGFVSIPIPVMIDSWITQFLKERKEEYGNIRSWASLFFAFYAIIYGYLIHRFGFVIMPYASGLWILINILVIIHSKSPDSSHHETSNLKNRVFTTRQAYFMILLLFIVGVSMGPVLHLTIYVIAPLSGTEQTIGTLLFISALVQFPMLRMSTRMSRFSFKQRFLFGFFLYAISIALLMLANQLWMVYIARMIDGIGFGILLPTIVSFTSENSTYKHRSTALSYMDAAQNGIGISMGSALGGYIMYNLNISWMLFTSLFLMIGVVLSLGLLFNLRK